MDMIRFLFILALMLAPSILMAAPPPLVRNELTTNATVVATGTVSITVGPAGTVTINGAGGGGAGPIFNGANQGSGVGIFSGTNTSGVMLFKSFSVAPTNGASAITTNGTDVTIWISTNYASVPFVVAVSNSLRTLIFDSTNNLATIPFVEAISNSLRSLTIDATNNLGQLAFLNRDSVTGIVNQVIIDSNLVNTTLLTLTSNSIVNLYTNSLTNIVVTGSASAFSVLISNRWAYINVQTNAGGSGTALTNANPVLLSWLTNSGAAIKTVSAGSGISLTNEGTNIVIAATGGGSQTPWLQDINGGFFTLTNVGRVQAGSMSAAAAASPVLPRFLASNTNNSGILLENTLAVQDGPFALLYAAPGVAITNTVRLGGFLIGGTSSSSTYRNATLLTSFATENWVDGSAYGAGFRIETTATGGTTRSAKLTVNAAGGIQFNTYGAGALSTDASGNITAASDENLKDLIGSYTNGLESVLGLEPVQYRWKESSGFDPVTVYSGFSAQNVQEFIPDAAGIMQDGSLTIQDRTMMAALVNAVKELSAKLEERDDLLHRLIVEVQSSNPGSPALNALRQDVEALGRATPRAHPDALGRLNALKQQRSQRNLEEAEKYRLYKEAGGI